MSDFFAKFGYGAHVDDDVEPFFWPTEPPPDYDDVDAEPPEVDDEPQNSRRAAVEDSRRAEVDGGSKRSEVDEKPKPEVGEKPRGNSGGEPKRSVAEDAVAVFRRWLYMPDEVPLLAALAAATANRSKAASPVWLLLVGPPSSGKTEIVVALAGLKEAVLAATVTEAALLSGTSAKERAKDATGGLLRQIGKHGLILCKDFTSVLAQNADARNAALAALREVYDGSWARPVGTDGGKVLQWKGKCGLIGGVTGAYDRHHSVIASLGDRFLLVRVSSGRDDTAAGWAAGLAALTHGQQETVMRRELAAAATAAVDSANLDAADRPLSEAEQREIVRLALFAARVRTPVDRSAYTGDLLATPDPEGPGRLAIALRQLLGGLEALGVDNPTRWRVLRRVAHDAAPPLRATVARALLDVDGPTRTSVIAERVGLVTKTAARTLDDLALIGFAERSKASEATNAPDLWVSTELLRQLWPHGDHQSRTENYPPPPADQSGSDRRGVDLCPTSPSGERRSETENYPPPDERGGVDFCPTSPTITKVGQKPTPGPQLIDRCEVCGGRLDPALVKAGGRVHPTCEGW